MFVAGDVIFSLCIQYRKVFKESNNLIQNFWEAEKGNELVLEDCPFSMGVDHGETGDAPPHFYKMIKT